MPMHTEREREKNRLIQLFTEQGVEKPEEMAEKVLGETNAVRKNLLIRKILQGAQAGAAKTILGK